MNAARHQWNDLFFTEGRWELFDQYVAGFNDMKKDYEKQQPPASRPSAGSRSTGSPDDAVDYGTTVTFPRLAGPKNDPIVAILNRVQSSPHRRRKVGRQAAVNMHTIRGHRGKYLADALHRRGLTEGSARFSSASSGASPKGHLETGRRAATCRCARQGCDPDQEVKSSGGQARPHPRLLLAQEVYLVMTGETVAATRHAKLVFTG